MNARVLFHDRCFDTAASAAVFGRFYRETQRADVTFTYTWLSYEAGRIAIFRSDVRGDENAIGHFWYSQRKADLDLVVRPINARPFNFQATGTSSKQPEWFEASRCNHEKAAVMVSELTYIARRAP